MDAYLFYGFGALAIAASIGVIGQRNPMHSVLWLIASFIGLAGLYVLLDAPFAAVTQMIVYAGAIMVLFLFVVMLLNTPREDGGPSPWGAGDGLRRAGALLAVALVALVAWALVRTPDRALPADAALVERVSSVSAIGRELFTTHVFAFEVTTVLLLVAMIGAVVLAKKVL